MGNRNSDHMVRIRVVEFFANGEKLCKNGRIYTEDVNYIYKTLKIKEIMKR
jgi:hypothetical protein